MWASNKLWSHGVLISFRNFYSQNGQAACSCSVHDHIKRSDGKKPPVTSWLLCDSWFVPRLWSMGTGVCYTCGSEAVEENNIKFTATLLSTDLSGRLQHRGVNMWHVRNGFSWRGGCGGADDVSFWPALAGEAVRFSVLTVLGRATGGCFHHSCGYLQPGHVLELASSFILIKRKLLLQVSAKSQAY